MWRCSWSRRSSGGCSSVLNGVPATAIDAKKTTEGEREAQVAPRPPAGQGFAARTFTSLGNRDFRSLWLGMLLMMGGMNMQMVARAQLAWELTESTFLVALVGTGFAVPVLVLSLFGGTVADRVERKKLIQLGQLGTAVGAALVALAILTDQILYFHLFLSSVLQGFLWAFLMPARQAIIPQLVGREHMSNAIALNASGMSLMTLIAPGIAGVLYAQSGPGVSYVTIAALNVGALLMTSRLPKIPVTGEARSRRVWADMKDGLSYVGHNRTVMMLLLLALSTTLLAQPFRQVMPPYVESVFHQDDKAVARTVGLFLSLIGGGSLVGTLLIASMGSSKGRGLILLATTAISGVAILLAASSTSMVLAMAAMLMLGIGDSGRRSLNSSLIMEESDESHRGRVMGVYMMNFGMIPLGALPLAAVADLTSIRAAFAGVGALLLAVAVAGTVATKRIRRL